MKLFCGVFLVLVLSMASIPIFYFRFQIPLQSYMKNAQRALSSTAVTQQDQLRISYSLHNGDMPYNNTFNPYVRCDLGWSGKFKKRVLRRGLPPQIKNVLNFTTSVTTNLNILIMGDSVGVQFYQGFEEACGATFENRHVYRNSWGSHEGLATSAPVRGGGVVAGWRITGMLKRDGENKALPNSAGGGWVREDAMKLLNHSYVKDGKNQTVGSFDAMVFRIPHGWLSLEEIMRESLQETVELAHELFGVSTVIFVSLPFVNNVQTMQHMEQLYRVNTMLRDFCNEWTPQGGVEHVSILEFGNLMDELMEWNARLMGYDTALSNYTMERLSCCPAKKLRLSIAQVCADRVAEGIFACERNSITVDGMHWCMENIGGRFFAGVSCLLGCVYNSPGDEEFAIRDCEKNCNSRFMSVKTNSSFPSLI